MAIDEETLKHVLADNPPSVVPLEIKRYFESLSEEEKLYAHYLSMYDSNSNMWTVA
jgi:dipeptidyl-peptidase III